MFATITHGRRIQAFQGYCATRLPYRRAFVASTSRRLKPPPVVGDKQRSTTVSLSSMPFDSSTTTKTYSIQATGQRSKTESTTNTGHVLKTDVPKSMGGTDAAPQPVETLLAAWIGCTQATAIFVGRQMDPRLLIDKMEFDVQAFRDERGALTLPINETPTVASRIHTIRGTIRVFGKGKEGNLIADDRLQLLAEQTEVRCPVANMMIASGCQMDVEWINGNASV